MRASLIIAVFLPIVWHIELVYSQVSVLDSANFKIKARLQFDSTGKEIRPVLLDFAETYSNENRRALIEPLSDQSSSLPEKSRYFSTTTGKIVEYEPGTKRCSVIDAGTYLRKLFGTDISVRVALAKLWQPMDKVPDFLLGLGRLLAIVEANYSKLRRSGSVKCRGQICFEYLLTIQWAQEVQVTLSVYYTREISSRPGNQPIRIRAQSRASNFFTVDYFSIEPDVPTLPFKELNYQLDATTLPLGVGCSAASQLEKMSTSVVSAQVFSMRILLTDYEHANPTSKAQFIAYDPMQLALRRDTLIAGPARPTWDVVDESDSSKTIYDLKRGRQYNIKYRRGFASSEPGVRVFREDTHDCVASDLEPSNYVALLPLGRLTHAGSGLVRGLMVEIYEMVGPSLPPLFFQPARYVGTGGLWLLDKVSHPGQPLTTVYYFANNGVEVEKPFSLTLLRVDFFKMGKLIKQIDVHNFAWRLVDAPNGDPQESLFVVHQSCAAGSVTSSRDLPYLVDEYVDMKFQLESIEPLSRLNPVFHSNLESVPARNAALLRGLNAKSRSISAVQVSDLRSFHLKNEQNGCLEMTVHAKLSITSDDLYRPRMVSFGSLYPNAKPMERIYDFASCFNEACRRRRSEHILFAFTEDGHCYIDNKPHVEISEKAGTRQADIEITYSNIFRLRDTKSSSLRIMQVDLIEPKNRQQSKREAWIQLKNDLLPEPTNSSKFDFAPEVSTSSNDKVSFRVIQLELRKGPDASDDESLSLDEVGFVSGRTITSRQATMSLRGCRSACLGDLECRYYSICINGPQLECVNSNLDLVQADLLAKLREQQMQWKTGRKLSKKIEIEIKSGTGMSEPTQLVELKLDRKCQIHRKRSLESFVKQPKTLINLNGLDLIQVDSENECSEKCLQMNLQYLRDVAKLRLDDSDAQNLDKIRAKLEKHRESWCATFKYLNLISTMADSILKESENHKSGLCLLPRKLDGNNGEADSMQLKSYVEPDFNLPMDTFIFSYLSLYRVHQNIQMLPYPRDGRVIADTDSTRDLVNRREVIEAGTAEDCARACVMQTADLEPWCKSFEFIQIGNFNDLDMGLEGHASSFGTLCAFNSMSLEEAERAGVYKEVAEEKVDFDILVKHYEPHTAYLMNDRVAEQVLKQHSSPNLKGSEVDLSLLLVILAATLSGLALSVKLKGPLNRLVRRENLLIRRFSDASIEL